MAKIDPKGWYRELGIAPAASLEDVRDAFRAEAKRRHPDAGGDAAAFRRLKDAYAKLSDPAVKARYDASFADALSHRVPAPIAAGLPVESGITLLQQTATGSSNHTEAAAAYNHGLRCKTAGLLVDVTV